MLVGPIPLLHSSTTVELWVVSGIDDSVSVYRVPAGGVMSNKYEKEIEEILKRAEEVLLKDRAEPSTTETKDPESSPVRCLTGGRGIRISAGKLMLASFALLLVAMILGAIGVGPVVYLVIAGLILFVIAYALFFVRPGGGSPSGYEKRWRGHVIEESPPLWDRLKRWLRS